MFKSFFRKKEKTVIRKLETPQDLQVGDIIKFKPRSILPPQVQGKQFEVTGVGTYQYHQQLSKELQLRDENDEIIFLAIEEEDGKIELALSLKISRKITLGLFNEDQFSELWDEEFPTLQIQNALPELEGWISDNYHQTTKMAEAYYYNRDCSQKPPSKHVDDDGDELRYHECTAEDDSYSLSVEIWADGSTDVSLVVYTPLEMIEDFWPK
ncbi:MAG: DUF4178 domain-containing protein [Desulfotalea sp.]